MAITEPLPPATENKPNPNILTGSADGDNSYNKKAAGEVEIRAQILAGTTDLGELVMADSRPKKPTNSDSEKPGRRTSNPLSNFSSYTYQLSLYMITPDAYEAFVISGRKNINVLANESSGGAFLIAQSGGINTTSSKRAPGFELDFYIDDLKIRHAVSGKSDGTASNVTNMSFIVYEPYGFSFISRLRKASEALQANSQLPNYRDLSNPLKQFFVLGIRFQGYDVNGNPLTNNSTELKPDSATSQTTGIYERFYDIYITSMKFTLDGKMSTYRITAATLQPSTAYSTKRALINSSSTVIGETVFDVLKGDKPGTRSLISILNEQQQQNKSKTVFKLEFIGPSADIENARLVTTGSDKTRAPGAPISATNQSNESASVRSTPNLNLKSIALDATKPIMQVIGEIIKESEYMDKAVNTLQKTSLDGQDSNSDQEKNNRPKKFRWYNLSAIVKCKEWNKLLSDWDYEITYVIQSYLTPALVSPYVNFTDNYYGPHKRYEYWYTGKNSEIISYEQVYNNLYYQIQNDPIKSETAQNGKQDTPQAPNLPTSASRAGAIGTGNETRNSVMANLFDPTSYVNVKVQIMGDPDYLMQDSPGSLNDIYSRFYGVDGYTINPNGGQVFFEIYFREGIDYDNQDGLLSINSQVLMWDYPKAIQAQVKGVSYVLNTVDSNFTKGKFFQELRANINSFPNSTADANVNNREKTTSESTTNKDVRVASNQAGTIDSQNPNGTSTGNTGYTPDNEFAGVDEAIAQQANSALLPNARDSILTNNQTSPTGGAKVDTPIDGAGTRAENNAGQQSNTGVIVSKAVADDEATINTIKSTQVATVSQDDGRELPEDTRDNRSV